MIFLGAIFSGLLNYKLLWDPQTVVDTIGNVYFKISPPALLKALLRTNYTEDQNLSAILLPTRTQCSSLLCNVLRQNVSMSYST